jgi:hypothetical protein
MAIAVAYEPVVEPARTCWDDEIGRLLDTAPGLPRAAQDELRRVLGSLLDEPALARAEACDMFAVLDVIDP